MFGKLLRIGGKAACVYAGYKLRRHRTESAIALGVVGMAVAAGAMAVRSSRRSAMRGKVVVITGGSTGLGLTLAEIFGRNGAHLVLTSRNGAEQARALEKLVRDGAIRNEHTALTVVCDVTKPEDCAALVQRVIERYGRIDVLLNVAGVIDVAPFQDQPLSVFQESMQVNFFGALNTIQAALPHMQAAGSGRIVNIASIGGKIAVPHMLPYVASKYALVGFSEGLRSELSGTGVTVTTVCPGLMRTGSHTNARFGGNSQAEYNWFSLGATLPFVSANVQSAAQQIYNATADGAAEITITPQAWLGARIYGLLPGFSADVAGLAARLLLPKPSGNKQAVPGSSLKQPTFLPLRMWDEHLERSANEPA